MSQKILCLSPHADDVELAMGGYIARMVESGDDVTIALLSASDYQRPSGGIVTGAIRLEEQAAAVQALGCKMQFVELFTENWGRTTDLSAAVSTLGKVLDALKPDGLFVPLPWFNQDHTFVWEAVQAALRPRMQFKHPAVYAYEMPGQEFGPPSPLGPGGHAYVELKGEHINKQVQALGCHKSQGMAHTSHNGYVEVSDKLIGPKGVYHLARLRGMEAGTRFAERFQFVRKVNRL